MSSSGSSIVEVRITGALDSSAKTSTAEAAALYSGLASSTQVSAGAMRDALKAVGGDLSKITPEMVGLG
jgi:hypothetical protein